MSVVAWRLAREERRRSEARVAALAAEIHGAERPLSPRAVDELEIRPRTRDGALPAIGLFSSQATPQPASRLFAVVGIGVLAFGSAVALAVMLGRRLGSARRAGRRDVGKVRRAPAPLELVALSHERDGDRLIVAVWSAVRAGPASIG